MLHTLVETSTKNVLSKTRAPIATVTKTVAKPMSKAKVTAVPKPTKAGTDCSSYDGAFVRCVTSDYLALDDVTRPPPFRNYSWVMDQKPYQWQPC
jgi:hypothetical protein